MKINAISHSHFAKTAPTAATQPLDEPTTPQDQTPPTETQPPTEEQSSADDQSTKVPGVIRLLNEGHFKPVADIRLRINFADQLNTTELPAPPENVHGKAYDKFLARYQQLITPPEPPEQQPEEVPTTDSSDSPDTIDITA